MDTFGRSAPSDEIDARVQKLQQHLQAKQIQGALILQNADLFYFSGTIQQAHLFIPARGEAVLMVRKMGHQGIVRMRRWGG